MAEYYYLQAIRYDQQYAPAWIGLAAQYLAAVLRQACGLALLHPLHHLCAAYLAAAVLQSASGSSFFLSLPWHQSLHFIIKARFLAC